MPLWNPLCSRTKFQLIHLQGNGNKHAWYWKGKKEEEVNNASISHLCFPCYSCLIQKSVHRQQFIPRLFPWLKVLAVWVVTCLLIAWNQHYNDLIDLWCCWPYLACFWQTVFIRLPPSLQIYIFFFRFPEFYLFPLFNCCPSKPHLQHCHEALLELPNKHCAKTPDTNFSSGLVSCFL